MSHDFLDRYSRGNTVCHRLPERLKIVVVLAIILAAGLLPIRLWPVHACLAILVFIGLSVAEIPLAYLWRRVMLLFPFVVCVALAVPMSRGFTAGWEIGAGIVIRAFVSFLAGLWLVNVTPFDRMLAAFGRLGMPRVLVDLLSFMYRYVFVLFDELGKMRTARRARNFGARGAWAEWKSTTQLLGMLLIRAMNRAERIHGAMCARNWSGKVRPLD